MDESIQFDYTGNDSFLNLLITAFIDLGDRWEEHRDNRPFQTDCTYREDNKWLGKVSVFGDYTSTVHVSIESEYLTSELFYRQLKMEFMATRN
jgi:hypothetical protein